MSSRHTLSTEAVVLRSVQYREADLILTLFTKEHGRISALARSGRKSQKRFGGCLGFFMVSTMELGGRPGVELWALQSAELMRSFADLALDLGRYAHASYGTELVRELTAAEVADAQIFDLLVELYEALATVGPSPLMLRAFELRLLGHLGLAPVIARCVSCGIAPLPDRGAVFDPSRGGVCCATCAALARGVGVRPISGPAIQILTAAHECQSLAEAQAIPAVTEDVSEARDALLSLILGHVGKPLRSVEFIAKVSGAGRERERKT